MDSSSQSISLRTRLGALCLALGPLTFVVVQFLNPYGADSKQQVHVVRTESSTITTWSLLWLTASFLLVASAVTMVGQVKGRGGALAFVGGCLAAGGAVAGAAIAGFESVALTLAIAFPDDASLDKAMKAFDHHAPVLALLYAIWLLGTLVGWPLLFGGAARGRLLSAWWIVPVVIGLVGQAALNGDSAPIVVGALSLVFVTPFLVVAHRIGTASTPSVVPASASFAVTPV